MKRIATGTLAVLALALIAGGCAGLRARGEGEVPKDVEEVDTWVVDREEAPPVAAAPDTAAPVPAEPVVSGVPETENAAAEAAPEPEETAVAAETPAPPAETPAPPVKAEPLREEIAAVPAPAEESIPAPEEPETVAAPQTRYIPGFRVQVLASRNPEDARRFAEKLRNSLADKVYVEYLAPYYKVRVGDCATRAEARGILRRMRDKGYSEAWIAETLVVKRAGKRP